MEGLIIVVQPLGDGWQGTVWEGCFVIFDQAGYTSFVTATAAVTAWVGLYRPGTRYLVELRSVPEGVSS